MNDIAVQEEGVRKLLKKCNPNKASGPDCIPARILRECADEIALILTAIFTSIETGMVPEDWRQANISAVFKKKKKAANYRPVSLTSLSCKLMEHVIVSNVMKHLDTYQIITDCQHSFRMRRSCETQLVTLIHELSSALDEGTQTDMVILNFPGRVPNQRLLKKLHHYGIRGNTHRLVSSFLTNRTQQVVTEGSSSEKAAVISGVSQGTVLGPRMFLIFINDLPDKIASRIRIFADDCIVYSTIKYTADCEIMQQDLATLESWERNWGMEFHPKKCSVLRTTRSCTPIYHEYRLKGHILEVDNSSKYPGVDIQFNLNWNVHIDRVTKKANSMLGF